MTATVLVVVAVAALVLATCVSAWGSPQLARAAAAAPALAAVAAFVAAAGGASPADARWRRSGARERAAHEARVTLGGARPLDPATVARADRDRDGQVTEEELAVVYRERLAERWLGGPAAADWEVGLRLRVGSPVALVVLVVALVLAAGTLGSLKLVDPPGLRTGALAAAALAATGAVFADPLLTASAWFLAWVAVLGLTQAGSFGGGPLRFGAGAAIGSGVLLAALTAGCVAGGGGHALTVGAAGVGCVAVALAPGDAAAVRWGRAVTVGVLVPVAVDLTLRLGAPRAVLAWVPLAGGGRPTPPPARPRRPASGRRPGGRRRRRAGWRWGWPRRAPRAPRAPPRWRSPGAAWA